MASEYVAHQAWCGTSLGAGMGDWRRGFNSGLLTAVLLLTLGLGVSSITRSCGRVPDPGTAAAQALTDSLNGVRAALSAVRDSLAAEKDSSSARLATLQQANTRLTTQVRQQRQALDALRGAVTRIPPDSLAAKVVALEALVVGQDSVIASQDSLLAVKDSTIAETNTKLTIAEAEARAADATAATWQAQAAKWETDFRDHLRSTAHPRCGTKCGMVIGAVATVTIGAAAVWAANTSRGRR